MLVNYLLGSNVRTEKKRDSYRVCDKFHVKTYQTKSMFFYSKVHQTDRGVTDTATMPSPMSANCTSENHCHPDHPVRCQSWWAC